MEPADSDGLGCLTPDSTKATLQQDDYGKGEYSPGVVLSKTGMFRFAGSVAFVLIIFSFLAEF